MKKLSFFLLIVLIGLTGCSDSEDILAEKRKNLYSQIIPEPSKIEVYKNNLLLNSNIAIYSDDTFGDISVHTQMLQEFVTERFRHFSKGSASFNIIYKPALGAECYELSVYDNGITIYASTKNGIFYGIQTFFQFLLSITDDKLPYLLIEDCPQIGRASCRERV